MGTHPRCPTCQCPPPGDHVIVYPANPLLYGVCPECRAACWHSERFPGGRGASARKTHCGCCPTGCSDHEREVRPGG